jgi:hypothetical protein
MDCQLQKDWEASLHLQFKQKTAKKSSIWLGTAHYNENS